MRPEIEFDAAEHRYTIGGRRVPSVTQVLEPLNDFSRVDPDVLERAREFGTNAHAAIHLYDTGELDEASLDPALLPVLQQWQWFLAHTGAVVLASELRVSHRIGYAGTLDKILYWRKREVLCDIKTGVFEKLSVGLQCAAYVAALEDCGAWPRRIRVRYCIHLTGAIGRMPRARPLTDPSDWPNFVSLLNARKLSA